ncbi:MAG: hypothetical protein ISS43_01985 [Candidatus Omnitrophica bacterium]|nr:hypothetical protein [Candidatus Omnitrophota bacterium]
MNVKLLSHRATKRNLDFPERRLSVESMKRQRILSGDSLTWSTLKHYPCIFFDQRLRSRLFR